MSHPHDPGVRVTRRATLRGAASIPALWALSSAAARASSTTNGDVEGFLETWAARTLEVVAEDEPNEEAHLQELIAGLSRIDPQALPERMRVSYAADGMKSGPAFARPSFVVIRFDLEPAAVIRAHNHVGWSFVSMGLAGEVLVRHFEPLGEAPDPATELRVDFALREVSSALLTRGRTSSLTRTRANVHGFRAGPEGATFIDFGVQYPQAGEGYRAFSALELDEQPRDAARRVHTARWIGNPYADD